MKNLFTNPKLQQKRNILQQVYRAETIPIGTLIAARIESSGHFVWWLAIPNLGLCSSQTKCPPLPNLTIIKAYIVTRLFLTVTVPVPFLIFGYKKKNEEFIYKSKLPSWRCVPNAMRAMVGQQVGGTLVGDSLSAKTWLVWQMAIPNLCLYF